MKKALLIIIVLSAIINTYGQINYINVCSDCDNFYQELDFNSANDSSSVYINIDETQANNIWQIGNVNKNVFTSGEYFSRALVTDTINSYLMNNTSSFVFAVVNCSYNTSGNCGAYGGMWLSISHKINSDLNMDGGTIEVSHNNSSWINIIDDSLVNINGSIYGFYDTIKSLNMPGFSGNSDDWESVNISFDTEMTYMYDTISFRFTFASDSIQTNKDGWVIGQIQIGGYFESIKENQNNSLISIFPNPTSNELFIQSDANSKTSSIQIMDVSGKIIYEDLNFKSDKISTQKFNNGIYMLKYSNGNNYSIKKFIVNH